MKQKSLRKDWPVIPVKQWDRGNLLEWRASLPKARRIEDHDLLAVVFAQATRVPMLRDALKWAESHNIDFIVDHTVTAGGYYKFGTGVVAIAKPHPEGMKYSVRDLVHEICHARQDYHGLLPLHSKSFLDCYIRIALCEADAKAHQMLAQNQFLIADQISEAEKVLMSKHHDTTQIRHDLLRAKQHLEQTATDTEKLLFSEFRKWYPTWAKTYHSTVYRYFAHALGVPGVTQENLRFEYRPKIVHRSPHEGLDITSFEGLQALSRSFNGRHYFNTREAREFLFRTALSPDRASQFFQVSNYGPHDERKQHDPKINEVRKRQLLLKHHLGRDVMI